MGTESGAAVKNRQNLQILFSVCNVLTDGSDRKASDIGPTTTANIYRFYLSAANCNKNTLTSVALAGNRLEKPGLEDYSRANGSLDFTNILFILYNVKNNILFFVFILVNLFKTKYLVYVLSLNVVSFSICVNLIERNVSYTKEIIVCFQPLIQGYSKVPVSIYSSYTFAHVCRRDVSPVAILYLEHIDFDGTFFMSYIYNLKFIQTWILHIKFMRCS